MYADSYRTLLAASGLRFATRPPGTYVSSCLLHSSNSQSLSMTQPSLFVRLARCVGGMTVQLRFWCWGVVIVGSAVCQFTCDTNPCMFLSPAQTCCPTYPCQNTSNPNEQFVELAIIENFSYGNYRSIQVAIDRTSSSAYSQPHHV